MTTINFSLYLTLLVVLAFSQVHGLCDQRPIGGGVKCCKARDSHCYVLNRSNVTSTRKICYCDEYCKVTKDCCDDYDKTKSICGAGPIDCKVSNWTEWTPCSVDCGFGVMKRKRYVTQLPKNGGKQCSPLRQVRGCSLGRCSLKQETALILPETFRRLPFGSWGYEKILPAHEVAPTDGPMRSYCVHFKLMLKRPSCRKSWADKMQAAQPVCVECQARVMNKFDRCRGDGKVGQRTRWVALGIDRCYGDWMRVGPAIPDCTCTQSVFSNFVFV